jgi:hypothetical protein
MVSESKSNWQDKVGLVDDTECGICGIPLYKQSTFFTTFVTPSGLELILCQQCGSLTDEQRINILNMAEQSAKGRKEYEAEFLKDHGDMIAMSELDSNMNGAVDYASWMRAAKETFGTAGGGAAAAAAGAGETDTTKVVSILPDDVIAAEIKRMKESSDAEMAAAAAEWNEKEKFFMTPSETTFLQGNGIHGPDSMNYMDWRGASVAINKSVEDKWLGKAAGAARKDQDIDAWDDELTDHQMMLLGLSGSEFTGSGSGAAGATGGAGAAGGSSSF